MSGEPPDSPMLDRVTVPADMKGMSDRELRQLADEVRAETISAVSVTGGPICRGFMPVIRFRS